MFFFFKIMFWSMVIGQKDEVISLLISTELPSVVNDLEVEREIIKIYEKLFMFVTRMT